MIIYIIVGVLIENYEGYSESNLQLAVKEKKNPQNMNWYVQKQLTYLCYISTYRHLLYHSLAFAMPC